MVDRNLNYGRHVMARFFRLVAPFENVLDVGAGHGSDLEEARLACPASACFGIEIFPPNVEDLKSRGIQVASLNLECSRLPFLDESFDVILSNQTLEHVKEVFWILHEISRIIRTGGHFIIGVPNLASFHNRLLLLMGRQPTCLRNHSAHVRGYTRHDVLSLFQRIFPDGYRLRAFGGSNFYPFPPVIARPLAKLIPNQAVSIFLLLQKVRRYDRQFLEYLIHEGLETNFFLGDSLDHQLN